MAVSFVLKLYLSETRILRETIRVASLTGFTFQALCECARRLLPNVDVSSLKWQDEEGELISLETDDHLLEALRSMQSSTDGKDYLRIYPSVVDNSDEPVVVDCVMAPQRGARATQSSARIQDITVDVKPKLEPLDEGSSLEPVADIVAGHASLSTDYLRITDVSSQNVQPEICAAARRICSRNGQDELALAASEMASEPSTDGNSSQISRRVRDATRPKLVDAEVLVLVKAEPIDDDPVADHPLQLAFGANSQPNSGSPNSPISSLSPMTTGLQNLVAKQRLSASGSSRQVSTAALKLKPNVAALLNALKSSQPKVSPAAATNTATAPTDRPTVDPRSRDRDYVPSNISGKSVFNVKDLNLRSADLKRIKLDPQAQFECTACRRLFSTRFELDSHQRKGKCLPGVAPIPGGNHWAADPSELFVCAVCAYACPKRNFVRHVIKRCYLPKKRRRKRLREPRDYFCARCRRQLASKAHLKRHLEKQSCGKPSPR